MKEFRPDEFRSVENPLKKLLDSEWLNAICPVCFVKSSESITMSLSTLRMLEAEPLCGIERGQLICWFSTAEVFRPDGTPRLDCVEIGDGIRAGLGRFSPLQIASAIWVHHINRLWRRLRYESARLGCDKRPKAFVTVVNNTKSSFRSGPSFLSRFSKTSKYATMELSRNNLSTSQCLIIFSEDI